MKIRVQPVYGYGWLNANREGVEVPAPFDLSVRVFAEGAPFKGAVGLLSDRDHPLSGMWISVWLRHVIEGVASYSLRATESEPAKPFSDSDPCITGFAEITADVN